VVVKAIRKRRREQIIVQNDQTITPDYIVSIFAKAKSCPYCGKKMSDVSGNTKDVKTLDHLIPIKKGGLHSRHNTIVCCHSCNSRKADKDFLSWLANLDEPYRSKAEKLYVKKYGALPTQGFLPLVFMAETGGSG
jgi:5-methylcytosine-specific restriction endonuclease McrA